MTDAEILVSLRNVSSLRGGDRVLDNISLDIARGEIVTLVGPNGAGKSTLVRTALGLADPDEGVVRRKPGIRFGYVPQEVNLDPTLPVSVSRFLRLSGVRDRRAIDEALERVGAARVAGHPMAAVSGGEMRRALLARALVARPDLLILDEPTSGVDISGQSALYGLIQEIRDASRCGILLVSHNLHVVMAATDRVVCLNRHLCCSGTPDDVRQHPEFMAMFGAQAQGRLGIYRHHHDHEHDLDGRVVGADSPDRHDG